MKSKNGNYIACVVIFIVCLIGAILLIMSVKNNNKTYDAAESAKILGLAPTWGKNKGVYYNKETRQHFIWDEKNHQFIVAEQIKQMNADGTYWDYSGKLHNL